MVKYKDSIYGVDTVERHKKIINKKGKVVWGIIKKSKDSPGIADKKIEEINRQVDNNQTTYAFLYNINKGNTYNIGKITRILDREEIKEYQEFIPDYYKEDIERCVAGIMMEEIVEAPNDINSKLKKYSNKKEELETGNQTNPLYVYLPDKLGNIFNKTSNENVEAINDIKNYIKTIHKFLSSRGYVYSYETIVNFYLSVKTKSFLILSGISGTGKSKLVREFARAIGANNENNRFKMISVKPDWNDDSELIGYKNIKDEFIPGELTKIIVEAMNNKNKPYFVCLDEMNLARIEYYFSDYLSLNESRRRDDGRIISDKLIRDVDKDLYSELYIPENLYVVGTVNMDDTTYGFSNKVLDRTNSIQFSEVNLRDLDFVEDEPELKMANNHFLKKSFLNIKEALKEDENYVKKVNEKIYKINEILKKYNYQFGYRTRDDIVFYMLENSRLNLLAENLAFDYQISQKILPKIFGSKMNVKKALIDLYNYCGGIKIENELNYLEEIKKDLENNNGLKYKKSAKKVFNMLKEYENGFTSYWI